MLLFAGDGKNINKKYKKYKVQDKVYKKIIFVQYRGDYRKPKEFERKNDIKRLWNQVQSLKN